MKMNEMISGDIRMKTMTLPVLMSSLMTLYVIFFSHFANAHGEDDKARFVSASGTDSGACDNRFRPCKSIAYAALQANKGDKILVAQGSYSVNDDNGLLYLISDLKPVLGGFNALDNFQIQQPDKSISYLTGVPAEYARLLEEKGFHAIIDSKVTLSSSTKAGLSSINAMRTRHSASECIDNDSSGFECKNISLLSHIPLIDFPTNSFSANDIWGHVDLNTMDEYALLGLSNGIAVVKVSDPENPEIIGSVSGQSTSWRDIKVYQFYSQERQRWLAYAYASADNVTEGFSILDLNALEKGVSLVARITIDRSGHNIYISNVDYTTNTAISDKKAMLHNVGGRANGGAWNTYSLENPEKPESRYTPDGLNREDYSHDISSVAIEDERALNHCDQNATSCNIIIDFNEDELRLWQHNTENTANMLGSSTYPNAAYVHSGWWSEDKKYVLLHDELDEPRFNLNTTVHIFDITDLSEPTLVSTWTGPTRATDHNGFTRGNKYYMSNYERGLTILDIADPENPQEVGFFDTFGASNNASTNGNWGVYPYLPSGTLLASDIQGGLYILKDHTLLDGQTAVRFSQTEMTAEEGTSIRIPVEKQGNAAMSVNFQIIAGSANLDDFSAVNGTLEWTQDATEPKYIDIDIAEDNIRETDELFFVRLSNPQQGTIDNSATTAFITINTEDVFRGQANFAASELSVKEIDGAIPITLERAGGSDSSLEVNVEIIGGSAANTEYNLAKTSVRWDDGDTATKDIVLSIIDDEETEETETIIIRLASNTADILGAQSELQINVRDDESNQAPMANAGADLQVNTRQTVRMNGIASDIESDVTIQWTQTSGTPVTLNFANSMNMSFISPQTETTLRFSMAVSDDFGAESSDDIVVNVVAPPPASSGGGTISVWFIVAILLLRFIRTK